MSKYETEAIFKMSELETIRQNSGMYIGSTEAATRLLEEALDNAIDEVQAGFCTIIGVFVDTTEKSFKVLDNARGFPFDQKLAPEKDPPIMSSTQMHTSGKFRKGDEDSPYKIAAGLHGLGLTAVNALSDFMEIEIYRDGKYASYKFEDAKFISRSQKKFKESAPFSTKVYAKPSERFFEDSGVDLKVIEERLRLVCACYPDLSIIFRVDDEDIIITGTVDDLILSYLTGTEDLQWVTISIQKGDEKLFLKLAWDTNPPLAQKILSCVNMVRVHDGVHINRLRNTLKDVFSTLGKKHKYTFEPNDCLVGLRCYMDLRLIKTSFEAQVKVRLESKTDLSIMDGLDLKLKKTLDSDPKLRNAILEQFQAYRNGLQSKKMVGTRKNRTSTRFTKLKDCESRSGELVIGEGDSAIGGLVFERNKVKHALLPLRGVIPNALTMSRDRLLKNEEVQDIVEALGTGFGEDCNIENLRYSKIIIATDADPAGHWIAALLIILFAVLVPDVIKNGNLYICNTPLFGMRKKNKFIPLWTKEEIEKAKESSHKILRFKGLGEFDTKDLKTFIFEEKTRNLERIEWVDEYEKIFELFTSSEKKRELLTGKWKL